MSAVRLIGRRDVLRRLDTLRWEQVTGRRRATVVTLVGMPGVGKTAVALHWAHRAAAMFDRQLYTDLRGHSREPAATTTEVLQAFLPALGVPAGEVPTNPGSQLGLYRQLSHDGRLLVILDGARDAGQVRPLLPTGPDCFTLVTSRDRLSSLIVREDAERLTLSPLHPMEAVMLVTGMLADRPGEHDPAAVRELARLCGYLPLALRIAVANLIDHPQRSLRKYVNQLAAADLLAELVVPGDDTTSMRDVLDVSYMVLDTAARRLLCVLAAAPRPAFGTAEVAVLAGLSRISTEQLLDALRAAHLIETASGNRYTMHSLVHAYAVERAKAAHPLEAGDRLGATGLAAG